LVEFMNTHKIMVESYGGLSPLFRVKNSPVVPVVEKIAEAKAKDVNRSVTTSQIILLWLKQKGVVAVTCMLSLVRF
jgi:diketogulonate reductase-like aldo/keto reductase